MRLSVLLAGCALAACTPQPGNEIANGVTNSIGEPAPAVTPTPEQNVAEPAAASAPGVEDNRSTARYRCIDGSRITVNYDPDKGTATIVRGGKRLAVLRQERAASGIWYTGQGYELRGMGDDMTFTPPDLPPLPCTVNR